MATILDQQSYWISCDPTHQTTIRLSGRVSSRSTHLWFNPLVAWSLCSLCSLDGFFRENLTLCWTNIAIENGNLFWIFPLKMVDLSIAMLVHQRVTGSHGFSQQIQGIHLRRQWQHRRCGSPAALGHRTPGPPTRPSCETQTPLGLTNREKRWTRVGYEKISQDGFV